MYCWARPSSSRSTALGGVRWAWPSIMVAHTCVATSFLISHSRRKRSSISGWVRSVSKPLNSAGTNTSVQPRPYTECAINIRFLGERIGRAVVSGAGSGAVGAATGANAISSEESDGWLPASNLTSHVGTLTPTSDGFRTSGVAAATGTSSEATCISRAT